MNPAIVLESVNPALSFLRRACALFWNDEGEQRAMKCPFCAHDIPELWQQLLTVTNSDSKALREPSGTLRAVLPPRKLKNGDTSEFATTAVLLWMECPNVTCRQLLVVVRQ